MQLLHGADLRCVIADERQLLHAAEEPGVLSSARRVCRRVQLAERSEEHTSELSRLHLVCRLLLEKKKHHVEAPRKNVWTHHESSTLSSSDSLTRTPPSL